MIKQYAAVFLSVGLMTSFSGCGKHEVTGGTFGAASGALVGNMVSGGKGKTTGTIVGALVGSYLGRAVGEVADDEERDEEQQQERAERAMERVRLQHLKAENQVLKERLARWCYVCCKQVCMSGAYRCPDCGYVCVREKFCECCGVVFSPCVQYKFCPYCRVKVVLSYR